MNYELIIFDMDGTILNTLEDLRDSLNFALRATGFPERTLEEVRRFVGNGIRKLIERGVPAGTSQADVDTVHQAFTPYYKEHCADKTRPYDGIVELLQKLRAAGCRTAVVSNKADPAVQELCTQYFDGLFDAAVGDREGIARKPAPDSVNEVLRLLNTDRPHAVYIGDSEVDVATAANAGLDCIAVTWGFREVEFLREQGAKVFADTPEEVFRLLQS